MATEVVVAAAAGFDVAALVLVPCSCYVAAAAADVFVPVLAVLSFL
jgi:hypothetical protein